MQHIDTFSDSPPTILSPYRPGGGRVASDRYRRRLEQCEAFAGLGPGFSRFDLLLLVKRAGRDAGFTPKMIQLVEYYLTVFTRDIDWEQGRPIVYQSLAKTALDIGVSERNIQKLEKQLFDLGAIGYVDSGNCRRYGQRDPRTGAIAYAFGVDLSPLAHLRGELEDRLHEKTLYNRAWHATKREVSACRRRIRSLLLEWREEGARPEQLASFEAAYQQIARQLRTHIRLEDLRGLLRRHQEVCGALESAMGVGGAAPANAPEPQQATEETPKSSSTSAEVGVPREYWNHPFNICSRGGLGFQQRQANRPASPEPASRLGVEQVTLKQVGLAASDRFRSGLPLDPGSIGWGDLVEAADRLRRELGITQASWGEACGVLGRCGAALCVLVTDRAALREEGPARQPAAYFRGMVNRGRLGELRLHRSIFGLIGREIRSTVRS